LVEVQRRNTGQGSRGALTAHLGRGRCRNSGRGFRGAKAPDAGSTGGTRPWSWLSGEHASPWGSRGSLEAPSLARSIGVRWPGRGLGEGHGGPLHKRDQTAYVCWRGEGSMLNAAPEPEGMRRGTHSGCPLPRFAWLGRSLGPRSGTTDLPQNFQTKVSLGGDRRFWADDLSRSRPIFRLE